MTPLEYYYQQVNNGAVCEDQEQLKILVHLQKVYEQLCKEQQRRTNLFSFLRHSKQVKGLYIWGSVGIGKTFLMDCLFACIPFQQKTRMHFHQFMQMIHHELKRYQGMKDPLKFIAANLAKHNLLICFDEFIVNDIADAMLLGRLFSLLFSHGVCLVTTSNAKPDDLYQHGLQRTLFLKTIALLKANTMELHLTSTEDYRIQNTATTHLFHTPNDATAHQHMQRYFSLLTKQAEISKKPININHRTISIIQEAADVIWFDFDKICHVPRSQHDYLTIAYKYKTVFISNVTAISPHENNKINLFIRLIDVFYDLRVRLVISSAVPLDEIYNQGRMTAEFTRTLSRLIEMQSEGYCCTLE